MDWCIPCAGNRTLGYFSHMPEIPVGACPGNGGSADAPPAPQPPLGAEGTHTLRLSIALAIFAIGGPETGRASALLHSIGRFRTLDHRAGPDSVQRNIVEPGRRPMASETRLAKFAAWTKRPTTARSSWSFGRGGFPSAPRSPCIVHEADVLRCPAEKGNEAPKRLKASTENRHRYLGRGQAPSWGRVVRPP